MLWAARLLSATVFFALGRIYIGALNNEPTPSVGLFFAMFGVFASMGAMIGVLAYRARWELRAAGPGDFRQVMLNGIPLRSWAVVVVGGAVLAAVLAANQTPPKAVQPEGPNQAKLASEVGLGLTWLTTAVLWTLPSRAYWTLAK
jgi:hypothetical protein